MSSTARERFFTGDRSLPFMFAISTCNYFYPGKNKKYLNALTFTVNIQYSNFLNDWKFFKQSVSFPQNTASAILKLHISNPAHHSRTGKPKIENISLV
uniref:Uncharacterized protein n=1 Tax=Anguilla anguilla TaxID=7936 RepID=A0A0E9TUW7_ANGAN